jgi:hypothetical protein
MPVALRIKGFEFYFYSNDHEPIHMHMDKGGVTAKIVSVPEIEYEFYYDFSSRELKQIRKIATENPETLKKAWYEHFNK